MQSGALTREIASNRERGLEAISDSRLREQVFCLGQSVSIVLRGHATSVVLVDGSTEHRIGSPNATHP